MVSTSILPPPEPYSNPYRPVFQNQHHQQSWHPRPKPYPEELCRPNQPLSVSQPALDIKDYPQHELDDLDPDRERKRQENVKTTLRMIDDALSYSK